MKSTIVLAISIISAVVIIGGAALLLREPETATLPIPVVDYFDANCPSCEAFHSTLKQLREDFSEDEVTFESVSHPILGESSFQAAYAAEAAGEQGAFTEYVDLLFENFEDRADEDYVAFAESLELDIEQFNADRNSTEIQTRVQERVETNRNNGITATPTVFVNDRRQTNNSYEALAAEIREKIDLANSQSE